MAAARKEIERLRATVAERAVGHHLAEGKRVGLSAGPVPSRVDACVKAGLLDLVDHAGWTPRLAAACPITPCQGRQRFPGFMGGR